MRLAKDDPGVTSDIVRYASSYNGLKLLLACFLTILQVIEELTKLFRDRVVEISRSYDALPLSLDVS